MTIKDRNTFAVECVLQGMFLGINPHYLMATAQLRSAIADDVQGDKIGPYRVLPEGWAANAVERDLDIDLLPDDIKDWRAQCLFAALTALRAQNSLMQTLGRAPTVAELYPAQWPEDADRPVAEIQAALDATAEFIDPAMKEVVGEMPATLRDTKQTPAAVSNDPTLPAPKQAEAVFVAKAPGIMEKLMADFDIKDFQAAAILGNIGHECAGFRTLQEIKPLRGKGGFGWCQWTGERRQAFLSFCKKNGFDATSDAGNYGFLRQELGTTQKSSLVALKATNTLPDAVSGFEQKFERAAANAKHYDRREHWANLALDGFAIRVPQQVAKLVDPDAVFSVLASTKSGTTTYWVLNETAEDGGQVLIQQNGDQQPEVLARDTTVFPIKSDKVSDDVGKTLSRGIESAEDPGDPLKPAQGATGNDAAAKLAAEAKRCSGTLISRNAEGTKQGKLACAWAVNTVARQALGKPIGGNLSTAEMGKVLKQNHQLVQEALITAGMVVISPTEGTRVGHVGIVGEIKSPRSQSLIYSNSSQRGVFMQNYTVMRWKAHYDKQKKLPVLFYSIKT